MHWALRDASREVAIAGISSPHRTPIIRITTINSIRVKPWFRHMTKLQGIRQ
jgi:hypothetical protein